MDSSQLRAARELMASCDVLDLHIDTFIWQRVFSYELRRRHDRGPLDARFGRQVDLPRLRAAGVHGAVWSITTNPFRSAQGRAQTLRRNLATLTDHFASAASDVRFVKNHRDYLAAKAAGLHAAFIGIQGGNAFGGDLPLVAEVGGEFLKVTLVHLLDSELGATSSPLRLGAAAGLTPLGREMVTALNRKRVFVDLAHISRQGFFDAVRVHDRSQPLWVSHTGVSGVYPHWRNLDDEQLRAVADTGGTIGVMYESSFLGKVPLAGRVGVEAVVDHIAHIIRVVGEDFVSLGSDWDGMIVAPQGVETCEELPVLVAAMLARGWSELRVAKILGGNALRTLRQLRP